MDTTTVRIKAPTEDERNLINILTTDERLRALVEAARTKARRLAGQEQGEQE